MKTIMSQNTDAAIRPSMPSREEMERLIQNGRRERSVALRAAISSLFARRPERDAGVAAPSASAVAA
ncbi:MAG: hypothetical protein AAFR23_01405 [Pseudomonadota bacterium]